MGEKFSGEYNLMKVSQPLQKYVGAFNFLGLEACAVKFQSYELAAYGFAFGAYAVYAYNRAGKRQDEIIQEELQLHEEDN